MSVWKIISGILSVIISLILAVQSLYAGPLNGGQPVGAGGVVTAAALLIAGILSVATHRGSKAGDGVMAALYGVGGLVGFLTAGNFAALYFWALWGVFCAFLSVLDFAMLDYYREDEKVSLSIRPAPTGKRTAASFEDVILEPDPRRRDAVIDALPERQAKSYLKQAMNVLVPRELAGEGEDNDGLVGVLIAVLAVIGIFIVTVIAIGVIVALSGG